MSTRATKIARNDSGEGEPWRCFGKCRLLDFDFAVVVAVVAMGMVQMAIYQIVDVVAVGHGFVAAAGTMDMIRIVTAASVLGSAPVRIRSRDFELMFHHGSIGLLMMEMPIVKIINVVSVLDCRVTAIRSMFVRVVVVYVFGHCFFLSFRQ